MNWPHGLSSCCFSSVRKKKKNKTKLDALIGVKHWGGKTAKMSAKSWFMCKQHSGWGSLTSPSLCHFYDRLRSMEKKMNLTRRAKLTRIFYWNIKSIHIPRLCWEFPFYRRWCLFKQRSRNRARPIGRAGRGRQMMMNTKEISSALTANKSRHFIIFDIYSSTVINRPKIWCASEFLQVNCKKSRNVAAENDLKADEWKKTTFQKNPWRHTGSNPLITSVVGWRSHHILSL